MTHKQRQRKWSRRTLLGAGGVTLATLAGCIGGENEANGGSPETPAVATSDSAPQLPQVENPPNVVYKPSHREEMLHLPTVEAGEYALTPMVTFSHRFWLVTGTETEKVSPDGAGVHLMFTPWDRETGQVLPIDAGATMRTFIDGELVDQRAPWPMISQTMGFHFGDNVPLQADGTYTVEVDLNPIEIRKTGAFADRFDQRVTAEFQFQYDAEVRQRLVAGVEYLPEDEWGQPGALEPMMHGNHGEHDDHGDEHGDHSNDDGQDEHNHDNGHGEHDDHDDHGEHEGHSQHDDHMMPYSSLTAPGSYPGMDLGEPQSGDAVFVVRYLEESRFTADGYIFVSPRTPYNRVPLPDMALSIDGDQTTDLVQTLDSELGLHYGASVDLSPGDTFDLVVGGPPQISRHSGYETAFLDMPPMRVEVPE